MEIDIESVDLFPVNLALVKSSEQNHLHPYPEHILDLTLSPSRFRLPDQTPDGFPERIVSRKENISIPEQSEAVIAGGVFAGVVTPVVVVAAVIGDLSPYRLPHLIGTVFVMLDT
jgi:beta-lactamase regulating signal transducer with metallopeptidase domain